MTAVLALLIGMLAGGEGAPASSSDYPLTPVFDQARRDRRGGAGATVDDETVGVMPPVISGIVTIERRIVIRIPTLPRSSASQPQGGARDFAARVAAAAPSSRQRATCLALGSVRGAMLDDRAGILFVTNGDNRYQAVLERGCRPVDFQSGFYLNPAADGAICAGRDMLHARSGLRCTITGLTRLASGM